MIPVGVLTMALVQSHQLFAPVRRGRLILQGDRMLKLSSGSWVFGYMRQMQYLRKAELPYLLLF